MVFTRKNISLVLIFSCLPVATSLSMLNLGGLSAVTMARSAHLFARYLSCVQMEEAPSGADKVREAINKIKKIDLKWEGDSFSNDGGVPDNPLEPNAWHSLISVGVGMPFVLLGYELVGPEPIMAVIAAPFALLGASLCKKGFDGWKIRRGIKDIVSQVYADKEIQLSLESCSSIDWTSLRDIMYTKCAKDAVTEIEDVVADRARGIWRKQDDFLPFLLPATYCTGTLEELPGFTKPTKKVE